MTRRHLWIGLVAVMSSVAVVSRVHAQWVVFDPSNYAEAIAEVEQIVKEYQFLVAQAQRMTVDLASRYRGYSIDWTQHDLDGVVAALPLMAALNHGQAPGNGYRAVSDALDIFQDIADRLPPPVRQRLMNAYATLELADSANQLAIGQMGVGRTQGPLMQQSIDHVETDNANSADAFQSQTALLERLSAASAIQLRQSQQTNQFLLSTLEQQLVDAKRKRDADVRLMDATIYQWRYGQTYGADLFRHTASDLDTWQPY